MIRAQGIYLRLHQLRLGLAISAFLIGLAAAAIAQERTLQLDPAQTSVKFTLGDVLHTVHGTFQLKRGTLEFAPDAGKLSGEIVVDAASGSSGSASFLLHTGLAAEDTALMEGGLQFCMAWRLRRLDD